MSKTQKQAPARVNGKFVSRKTLAVDNLALATATRDEWVSIIKRRVDALKAANEFVAVEWATIIGDGKSGMSNAGFAPALAQLIGAGVIDTSTLTRILGNPFAKKVQRADYVQAKTIVKVVNAVFTLAGGSIATMNDYTAQVLNGALTNGDALSIEGARATLSRRVSAVDLPNNEQIGNQARYSPGTATSQASQVRDEFRVLGLAEVNKGKRGDTMRIKPERAQALRDLYATDF